MEITKDGHITKDGRLVASLKRSGGGKSGLPVTWLVYWGLAYSQHPSPVFASQQAARAWVLSRIK